MARPFAVAGFATTTTLITLFYAPEWLLYVVAGVCVFGLLVAALVPRFRIRQGVSTWVISLGAGLLSCLLLCLQMRFVYTPALDLVGEDAQVRVVVTSNPSHRYNRFYYESRLLSLDGEDIPGRVKVRVSSPVPLYAAPYEIVSFQGNLFPLGQEDPEMRDVYRAKGMVLGAYATTYHEDRFQVERGTAAGVQPMRGVLWLQSRIRETIRDLVPGEDGNLLMGMLLGETEGLSWQMQERFRSAGISHIFAVSGLHLSILSWSLLGILERLRCPRRGSAVLSMLFVGLFVAVTGFQASCVRAGVMMLVMLSARLLDRSADALNSLGFAAVGLLCISPLSAGQVGFQLSFAATLGILLFQKRIVLVLKKYTKRLPPGLSRLAGVLCEGLSVTVAAMILTAPIQFLQFSSGVSLLSFLSNLLFVPLSGWAILLGGLAVVCAGIPGVPVVFVSLATPLLRFISVGVQWIVMLPVPTLRAEGLWSMGPLLLCCLMAAGWLCWRAMGRRSPAFVPPIAAGLVGILVICGLLPGLQRGVRVERLAVGEGVAVLVTEGRNAALLGCGGDPLPSSVVKRALSTYGIRELQCLLLPGAGTAVASASAEVRRDLPVRTLIEGVTLPERDVPFTLWEGAVGVFRNVPGQQEVRLTAGQVDYVLKMTGE